MKNITSQILVVITLIAAGPLAGLVCCATHDLLRWNKVIVRVTSPLKCLASTQDGQRRFSEFTHLKNKKWREARKFLITDGIIHSP